MFPVKTTCLLSAFLLASLSACAKENKSSAAGAGAVPKDFHLVFGEGGGFTGLWQGHTVTAAGVIYSWKGRRPGENQRPAGRLSGKQVQALWQEIQRAGFFAQEWNERGNMTAVLRVTANGATREWAWVPSSGSSAAKTAPQQLQRFCHNLIQQAVNQEKGEQQP